MKSWWWNFTEFQYQTWQCVFGVGWQHHEDSTTSLSACIPYRLYGDGAEAQRISSEVNQLLFQNCILWFKCYWFSHPPLTTESWGKQKFEVLTMQFPRCPSSATLDCRILHHGCIRKGNGLFDVSVFLFPYLVGSPKCALRLSVMNATYAKHAARTKILEVLAWSCNALGPSLQLLFFVWG